MKRIHKLIALASFSLLPALYAQNTGKTVTITTNVGTMKAQLYDDVPNHIKTFTERANRGDFDDTLFTRVIKEFMIQGGAPDSKTAPPGACCGFGDRNAEIMPEFRNHYFHKKGALAAPRQNDDVNPQKKSDMSQFFIVHGKVYRNGELDTLELVKNQPIRKKALEEYYYPVRPELQELKESDPREFNRRAAEITAKIDSVIRATPGHLIFTPEQREAYTTIGGSHHLDGSYTIYGEVTEGLDIIDKIALQAKDTYDRPKTDIRIEKIRVQ
ncbi:MAG: peptidylprolyl isomerase [Tannerellaceae bacterium]|nr:peptidylprolyl isomerase [Tannerellaceae bacterium]